MVKVEADPKQRSKVSWIKLGNKNNRYFSIATKLRRSKYSIYKILNTDENQTISRTFLEDNNVRYFKTLFSNSITQQPVVPVIFP